MKKNKFLEKNNLASLLEYKMEYREEQKRIDREAKRKIQSIVFGFNKMSI